jgi:hypothetical protein
MICKFLRWLQERLKRRTKPATSTLAMGLLSDLPRNRAELIAPTTDRPKAAEQETGHYQPRALLVCAAFSLHKIYLTGLMMASRKNRAHYWARFE